MASHIMKLMLAHRDRYYSRGEAAHEAVTRTEEVGGGDTMSPEQKHPHTEDEKEEEETKKKSEAEEEEKKKHAPAQPGQSGGTIPGSGSSSGSYTPQH